ncbi:MAG: hypothetical protein JRC93_01780 [Deltaproteobacteria bacterium]|nr:hypothetical protein [Deltaproteobacteria bacterium]
MTQLFIIHTKTLTIERKLRGRWNFVGKEDQTNKSVPFFLLFSIIVMELNRNHGITYMYITICVEICRTIE